MDLSSERKEETRWQVDLKPKVAGEVIRKGETHTHQLEGRIEKTRRARIVTDSPLGQLLTGTRSTMSLKLPRNWDFNLKMEAAKIARSRSVMTGVMTGEQMAAFHLSSTPNPLERPIKMGWLKKQRSIVKNWQQRYFVLKAQKLYYYKEEEDVKAQGCMYLPGSTIKEIATNPEEAGKFVFEVIPASWDQSRAGQDSYVLMASSQAEMEEWVKFLRRVAGAPSGAVFGQRLDETVAYEQKFGPHLVPILVEKCAEFILEHGLNEEGIFRLPGQDNLVKQLRDAFDAGERPSFDRDTDVHTVASLLKLYLRDLPEPVVPWSQYEGFLLCGQLMNADETKAQQELMKQLSILPRDNYSLLSYMCRFLHEIQLNCSVNKMSVDNLATVIGVNLIRSKVEDPAVIMRGAPQIQRVMTMMIRDHEVLFPKSKDAPLSPPAQKNDPRKPPVARSSVGWDATEDPSISRTDSFSNTTSDSDTTSPTGQRPSDECLEDSSRDPREKPGDWKLQSRKRTQTLPNRKCFLTSAFQGANSSKVEIFKNEFWSSSEGKAGEGHRRTMSQGVPQFSDSQRTSTYDNVPALPGSPRDEADVLSSHACDPRRDTLASPTSATGPGKKNSGEEELESLQSVVRELQKEIETQKQMYEEQIKNLEKENYDVWAKVVRLNEELEKEKKKFAALEISLRNVERSREDVEKRNKVLEEEVKEFVRLMKEPKTDA
ncbi:PREDICTED: rho GTPase-activating protein 25 isoform X2 [Ceratotherium simum simum]|uniref:Rho GTPase-activating protein 25 isoform X2 n=1 Tax=Ceratotherium simum simum TaxID=73337 RepID=A0ABM0HWW5_CERSS|nr:PREDICTED: rho GTPase-activating protein 25 isoform X2 [Ceratotherium simum simum]